MSAGLQIFNDSDTIVVDELYQNFIMSQSGQITTSEVAGSVTTYTATLVTTAQNPQVLFTNTGNAYIGLAARVISGGTTTLYFYADKVATFNYKLFSVLPSPPAGSAGLQVFTAAGSLVFDSGSSLLRTHSVIQVTAATSYSYSAPSKVIAACLTFSSFSVAQILYNPFPVLGKFVDAIQVTDSAVNTKAVLIAAAPGQPDQSYPPQTTNRAQILLADVTNY